MKTKEEKEKEAQAWFDEHGEGCDSETCTSLAVRFDETGAWCEHCWSAQRGARI